MTSTATVWDGMSSQKWSIACKFHCRFGHRLRYIGKYKWERLGDDGVSWVPDVKKKATRCALMDASTEILQRSIHWRAIALKDPDRVDIDAMFTSDTLMKIACNLKSISFQNLIIREAQEFFASD